MSLSFKVLALAVVTVAPSLVDAQRTMKPPLHGRHWMAITGKPLGATAGAMIVQKGGNAVDAACAMLAATSTMWDVLHWGGETRALIYHPGLKKVIGINALAVAPTGYRGVASSTPDAVRTELTRMGYMLEVQRLTSGPINAIFFDRAHGTFWGGSSNHGEDTE